MSQSDPDKAPDVIERHFKTKADALAFVKQHQRGRRNLTPEELAHLRGSEANTATRPTPGRPAEYGVTVTPKGRTREQVAEKHGVSPKTIQCDATFAKAVDTIGENIGPDAKQQILNGGSKLSRQAVRDIASKPATEQPAAFEAATKGQSESRRQPGRVCRPLARLPLAGSEPVALHLRINLASHCRRRGPQRADGDNTHDQNQPQHHGVLDCRGGIIRPEKASNHWPTPQGALAHTSCRNLHPGGDSVIAAVERRSARMAGMPSPINRRCCRGAARRNQQNGSPTPRPIPSEKKRPGDECYRGGPAARARPITRADEVSPTNSAQPVRTDPTPRRNWNPAPVGERRPCGRIVPIDRVTSRGQTNPATVSPSGGTVPHPSHGSYENPSSPLPGGSSYPVVPCAERNRTHGDRSNLDAAAPAGQNPDVKALRGTRRCQTKREKQSASIARCRMSGNGSGAVFAPPDSASNGSTLFARSARKGVAPMSTILIVDGCTPKQRLNQALRQQNRLKEQQRRRERGRKKWDGKINLRFASPGIRFNRGEFRVGGRYAATYRGAIRKRMVAENPFCRYCDWNIGETLDHLTPRSRGGTDDPANLILCCEFCNRMKGQATLAGYRDRLRQTLANVEAILRAQASRQH